MSARISGLIIGGLFYAGLWLLAVTAVPSWIPLLVTPLILALLVGGGVAIQRFMGITPHRPKFGGRDRHGNDSSASE